MSRHLQLWGFDEASPFFLGSSAVCPSVATSALVAFTRYAARSAAGPGPPDRGRGVGWVGPARPGAGRTRRTGGGRGRGRRRPRITGGQAVTAKQAGAGGASDRLVLSPTETS